ncbi:enoyl-CoA hydratase/isomerase family protein, partial [Rhizobiaceae sp. 2RAB30]
MENLLETVVTDGVCTATLNDPARSNPLSAGMLHSLRAVVERVRSDPAIRSVLLTARGKSFCAGGDLVDMDTLARSLLKR